MLKSLALVGFKSHDEETVFDLHGIDLLVGANSSGKSTVIQSLLLLKQSLDSSLGYAGIRTRGKYIDLGSPSSIINRRESGHGKASVSFQVMGQRGLGIKLSFSAADNKMLLDELSFDELKFHREPDSLSWFSSADRQVRIEMRGLTVTEEQHIGHGAVSSAKQFEITKKFEPKLAEIFTAYVENVQKRSTEERDAKSQALAHIANLEWGELQGNILFLPTGGSVKELDIELATSLEQLGRLGAISPSLLFCLSVASHFDHTAADCYTVVEELIAATSVDPASRFIKEERGITTSINIALNSVANSVQHVGPLRTPPEKVYPYAHCSQFSELVAGSAEYLGFLHENAGSNSALPLPDGKTTSVVSTVNGWLRHLGIAECMRTEEVVDAGYLLRIVPVGGRFTASFAGDTPRNVGMGFTQLLPIIISIALAKQHSVILIEQPEVHLHPSVCIKFGELLCAAAGAGVVLIVETHSEHIVNGVRLGVAQGCIRPDFISINFFETIEVDGVIGSRCQKLKIDDLGYFDAWPRGFFDESERITSLLAKARRTAIESRAH
jgi:predicted ATPase